MSCSSQAFSISNLEHAPSVFLYVVLSTVIAGSLYAVTHQVNLFMSSEGGTRKRALFVPDMFPSRPLLVGIMSPFLWTSYLDGCQSYAVMDRNKDVYCITFFN